MHIRLSFKETKVKIISHTEKVAIGNKYNSFEGLRESYKRKVNWYHCNSNIIVQGTKTRHRAVRELTPVKSKKIGMNQQQDIKRLFLRDRSKASSPVLVLFHLVFLDSASSTGVHLCAYTRMKNLHTAAMWKQNEMKQVHNYFFFCKHGGVFSLSFLPYVLRWLSAIWGEIRHSNKRSPDHEDHRFHFPSPVSKHHTGLNVLSRTLLA